MTPLITAKDRFSNGAFLEISPVRDEQRDITHRLVSGTARYDCLFEKGRRYQFDILWSGFIGGQKSGHGQRIAVVIGRQDEQFPVWVGFQRIQAIAANPVISN